MRTSCAVLAIVALMLAGPAAASAKGVQAVQVCGASGCQDVDRSGDLEWIVGGNFPVDGPDKPAPFYDVKVTIGHGGEQLDRFTTAYLPGSHMLRGQDENADPVWSQVSAPQSLAAFERATRGLRPYPASRLGPLAADKAPPAVRVVEVYEPARDAAAGSASGDGPGALPWVVGAAAAALVVGMGLAARRRIRIPRFPEG